MSGTCVQDTLQDEYTRDARVEDATARFVGKEEYLAKCVSLWSTGSICKEERWYTQVMYRLQTVEQGVAPATISQNSKFFLGPSFTLNYVGYFLISAY